MRLPHLVTLLEDDWILERHLVLYEKNLRSFIKMFFGPLLKLHMVFSEARQLVYIRSPTGLLLTCRKNI